MGTLWAWIAGVLRGLLRGLDRALGAHHPFDTLVGFVVIAAALGVFGFALARLVRMALSGFRARPRSQSETALSTGAQRSTELRAAALVAAGQGRFRAAAALLFLAAARALDERGRVAYDPARTPGEYRRLVREPLFDELAGAAVVALFAAAEPPGELFVRMSGAYDRLFDAPAR